MFIILYCTIALLPLHYDHYYYNCYYYFTDIIIAITDDSFMIY